MTTPNRRTRTGTSGRVACVVVATVAVVVLASCGSSDSESTDVQTNKTVPATSAAPTTSTTTSAGPDEARPTSAPDFIGPIDSVSALSSVTEVLGTTLIGGEVTATITAETRLWACDQNDVLVPIAFEEFDALIGQPAALWVEGPVAESHPMQARASAISVGACG